MNGTPVINKQLQAYEGYLSGKISYEEYLKINSSDNINEEKNLTHKELSVKSCVLIMGILILIMSILIFIYK